MIYRTLIFAMAVIFIDTPLLAAADVHTGKDLTDENCYQCHGAEIYTRADRKVKSLDGLRKQVQFCEHALGLTWFDEQVNDVADYLNQEFYKFK